MSENVKLTTIHENTFGFKDNVEEQTRKMSEIIIHDGQLTSIPKRLLPWDHLSLISILGNPVNCDPQYNWLLQDKNLKLDNTSTPRYNDYNWCKCLRVETVED